MYLKNDQILVLTDGFWNSSKRMRHKMACHWARQGNRVLWIEQSPFPLSGWITDNRGIRAVTGDLTEVEPGLWVGTMPPALPKMYKGGTRASILKSIQRPWYMHRLSTYMTKLSFQPSIAILMQQAARHDVLSRISAPIKIYYSYDLYGYGKGTQKSLEELKMCCRKVHMVWSTSEIQRRQLSQFNADAHHIPHAVDTDWWDENYQNIPPEYARIQSPRAVYTGVFENKLDLQLLLSVSTACPNWQFVFVGDKAGSLDTTLLNQLKQNPNVHILGHRPPEQLPGYIAGADMLMFPYLTDSANSQFIGLPLKFYEYLISGNPILATPYTDFETNERKLLYIKKEANQWISVLNGFPQFETDTLRTKRRTIARQNTYEARIDFQRQLLERWAKTHK